jgi:hypothetical protein
MAIILLVIVLFIGGGLWFLFYAIDQFKSAKSSSRPTAGRELVSQEGSESVISGSDAGSSAGGSEGSTRANGGHAGSSAAGSDPGTGSTAPAGGADSSGHSGTGADSTAASGTTQGGTTASVGEPVPTVESVQWPYLLIGGVVGKGLRGAATINGKIVSVGESIDGVEVVAIGDYGVKLECKHETRFAKVGSVIQ